MGKVLRYFLVLSWFPSLMMASSAWQETLDRDDILKHDFEDLEEFDAAADDQKKVIGGTVVAKGEFPFLVSVKLGGVHSFTGSVIDSRTVLTCAHCLQYMSLDSTLQNEYDVLIGVYNISKPIPAANKFKILKFYIYPTYKAQAVNRPVHDIGLIILDRAVDFRALKVKAARLTNGEFLEDYTNCWVAGWGAISDKIEWSDVPRKYPVKVILDSSICERRIQEALNSHTLWKMDPANVCGISDTSNHCQGDSGAPMWCKMKEEDYHVQLALVSTTFGAKPGSKCGVKGGVSIYTGVGGPHYRWIRLHQAG